MNVNMDTVHTSESAAEVSCSSVMIHSMKACLGWRIAPISSEDKGELGADVEFDAISIEHRLQTAARRRFTLSGLPKMINFIIRYTSNLIRYIKEFGIGDTK